MANYIVNTDTHNPWENLALESALMERTQKGDVTLYLWRNQNTVVIGKNQNPWKECKVQQLEESGGFLARRSSGGGAVFHDLGNLNFTFVTSPELYDLERQLKVICDACLMHGIDAKFSGRNDILVDGRKFSGNAFRFIKNAGMHHGTLLVNVDMQKLGIYLIPSQEKIRSKGVDSVRSRVCNLREFAPSLTTEDLRKSLEKAFIAEYGEAQTLNKEDLDTARLQALFETYSSWDWRYGKTMNFDVELSARFVWGGIDLLLQLKNARIDGIQAFSDAMDADLSQKLSDALRGCVYGPPMAEKLFAMADSSANDPDSTIYRDLAEWLSEKTF